MVQNVFCSTVVVLYLEIVTLGRSLDHPWRELFAAQVSFEDVENGSTLGSIVNVIHRYFQYISTFQLFKT